MVDRTLNSPAPLARDSSLIVFLVSSFTGHVYGSMGVGRRLQELGFEIEYWADRRVGARIREQGFVHRPIESVWYCFERTSPGGWLASLRLPKRYLAALRASRARRRYVPSALSLFERSIDTHLRARSPALVVIDPLLSHYYPLLGCRGIRCVVLSTKPLAVEDPLVPPPNSGLLPPRTAVGRARVAARWMQERLKILVQRAGNPLGMLGGYTTACLIDAVRERAGMQSLRVRRRVDYDLHFENLVEWGLWAPELDFPRLLPLPADVHYIGPCVDLRRVEPPSPVERKPSTRHLIYVSMGATVPRWNHDLHFLRQVLVAFDGLAGVQLVVTTGTVRLRDALGVTASNISVFDFLPQLAVLRMADLAITHAGSNTFRECIATGTPMLAFAREYDQPGNAARIQFHGLGLQASRRAFDAGEIRRLAFSILENDAFKKRVLQMGSILAKSEMSLLSAAVRDVLPEAVPSR